MNARQSARPQLELSAWRSIPVQTACMTLGVSSSDVRDIRKNALKSRALFSFTTLILLGVTALLGFIFGYALDRAVNPGYPWNSVSIPASALATSGRRGLASVGAFAFAFIIGSLVGGAMYTPLTLPQGAMYGVVAVEDLRHNPGIARVPTRTAI